MSWWTRGVPKKKRGAPSLWPFAQKKLLIFEWRWWTERRLVALLDTMIAVKRSDPTRLEHPEGLAAAMTLLVGRTLLWSSCPV